MSPLTSSCAWCGHREDDARYPDCDCRANCGALRCLPNFPAADVTPGMAIKHPHGCSPVDNSPTSGVLDVIAVTGPDAAGFVCLTSIHETVRIAGDCHVIPYTREDADFSAFLLISEQERQS